MPQTLSEETLNLLEHVEQHNNKAQRTINIKEVNTIRGNQILTIAVTTLNISSSCSTGRQHFA